MHDTGAHTFLPRRGNGTDAHPMSVANWQNTRQRNVVEVVEVKNSSPFRSLHERGIYTISDRGPATHVRLETRCLLLFTTFMYLLL